MGMNDLRHKSSRQLTYSEYSNQIYETDKGQFSSFLPKIYDILSKCFHEETHEVDLDMAAKRLSYELDNRFKMMNERIGK